MSQFWIIFKREYILMYCSLLKWIFFSRKSWIWKFSYTRSNPYSTSVHNRKKSCLRLFFYTPSSIPCPYHLTTSSIPCSYHLNSTSIPCPYHITPTSIPCPYHLTTSSIPCSHHLTPTSIPCPYHLTSTSIPACPHHLAPTAPTAPDKQCNLFLQRGSSGGLL